MTIQAIPTVYAGVHFRSRLEARVAALFDRAGMTWEYEPEAFHLAPGVAYLPDFRLPPTWSHSDSDLSPVWVEVKPQADAASAHDRKAELFAERLGDDGEVYLVHPSGPYGSQTLSTTRLLGIGRRTPAEVVACVECDAVQFLTTPCEYSDVCSACCHTLDPVECSEVSGFDLPQYQDGRMRFTSAITITAALEPTPAALARVREESESQYVDRLIREADDRDENLRREREAERAAHLPVGDEPDTRSLAERLFGGVDPYCSDEVGPGGEDLDEWLRS
jgi:hypothetical protein